jgi:hypothetical protein
MKSAAPQALQCWLAARGRRPCSCAICATREWTMRRGWNWQETLRYRRQGDVWTPRRRRRTFSTAVSRTRSPRLYRRLVGAGASAVAIARVGPPAGPRADYWAMMPGPDDPDLHRPAWLSPPRVPVLAAQSPRALPCQCHSRRHAHFGTDRPGGSGRAPGRRGKPPGAGKQLDTSATPAPTL